MLGSFLYLPLHSRSWFYSVATPPPRTGKAYPSADTFPLTPWNGLRGLPQVVLMWIMLGKESLMYLEVNIFVSNAGKQWLTGMVFADTSVSAVGEEIHRWSGANKKFSGAWIQVSSHVFCTVLDVTSIFCFPAPEEVKSADKLLHTWQ